MNVWPWSPVCRLTRCVRTASLLVALACLPAVNADEPQLRWELGPTGTRASLRGVSAPSSRVVWVCGSQATVLLSLDGGSSWTDCSPTHLQDLEIRSIHAWSARKACVASAGTPAIILLTMDGGRNWQQVYAASRAGAFFDGLRFWDERRGIAFSDPVEGRLLILSTDDGGESWNPLPADSLPVALEHEVGFAASNSSLALGPQGQVWIGTGGVPATHSRIHWRSHWQDPWMVSSCPIPSGSTQGVFSIAYAQGRLLAVGGDYRSQAPSSSTDSHSTLSVAISDDQGRTWRAARKGPVGFRSSVVYQNLGGRGMWVTAGPTGSDCAEDGDRWQRFSDAGFHALATGGSEVFAVGSQGRFAKLRY